MASAYVQWSMWTVRLLCWSTLWIAAIGDKVASHAVVKYWETMLHGGVMPSTIQGMLSPLTSQQTNRILLDINAYNLPTHAAAFCEVAHIQCGPTTTSNPFATSEPSSDTFEYEYKKADSTYDASLAKLPASDVKPQLFGYTYNKAGPKKLPASDASPVKIRASNVDPELFGYTYNKARPKKIPTSDASPVKLPASDVHPELFGYTYNKGGPKKIPTSDASPLKLPASAVHRELFGYTYNKAGPKKIPTSDASPAKLPAFDVDPELFGYTYNKAGPEKIPTSDASPLKIPASAVHRELIGYTYNKDGPKKIPTSNASPVKLPAFDVDPKLFGYTYNKAGPKKIPTSDASPLKLPASDVDPQLFGYTYNKAVPKKIPTSDASALKFPAFDVDPELFGYTYNKAGPKKIPTFDASPLKLPGSGLHRELVGYTYNKDGPKKTPTSDASPVKLPASDVEPKLFGYTYNKVGSKKVPTSDVSLLVGPKSKIGGAHSLMSSTIHEILGSFFREKQVLVSGFKIHVNLATYKSSKNDERAFLPRKLAQVFPISDEGVEKISHMLGFAKEPLQDTVDRCNATNNMSGEVFMCLASVEDISDFVSSTMASPKPINAYDSIHNARNLKFSGKTFIVDSVKPLKKDIDEPTVTCHDMNFPFRVFYCHYAPKTMIFDVKLQGEDGTSHERLAVCHYDTSYWNPKHVSFSELHTKPGEAEACHWLGNTWMGQSGWAFSYA